MALEAYEVRVRKLAAGLVDDASAEAEAGALLRAEADHDLRLLAEMVHAALTKRA